jgi:hypothetical protein
MKRLMTFAAMIRCPESKKLKFAQFGRKPAKGAEKKNTHEEGSSMR